MGSTGAVTLAGEYAPEPKGAITNVDIRGGVLDFTPEPDPVDAILADIANDPPDVIWNDDSPPRQPWTAETTLAIAMIASMPIVYAAIRAILGAL